MKNIIQFGCIFLSGLFLIACAGTKKVDFETAYKFSTYRYQKAAKVEMAKPDSLEHLKLSASIEHREHEEQNGSIQQFEESLFKRIGLDPDAAHEVDKKQIRELVSEMSAGERRKLRKDVKAELKKLRSDADLELDVEQDEQVSQMSNATRLSIVAGSVGLVLLILGAIFSVSFLTIVGAIITVGAAILFIVDQV